PANRVRGEAGPRSEGLPSHHRVDCCAGPSVETGGWHDLVGRRRGDWPDGRLAIEREEVETQALAVGQDHGTFDDVLQLPDVPGPVVARQCVTLRDRGSWPPGCARRPGAT